MRNLNNTCFVCKKELTPADSKLNVVVNMPVCINCQGTDSEKQEEKNVLDSLADGFVCGCI